MQGSILLRLKPGRKTKPTRLEALKKEYATLKQQEELVRSLGDEKLQLEKEIKDLQASHDSLPGDFVALIKKVRSSTVGLEMPEMKLPGEHMLKRVKVKSVTGTEIVVSHDQGVMSIPFPNLPDDFKLRFWIGKAPIAEIDNENLKAAPVVVANSASLTPVEVSAHSKLSVLQGEVRILEQQKRTLQTACQQAQDRESYYRAKTFTSKTNSFGVNVQQAVTEAAQYRTQIDAVAKKIVAIQNQFAQAEKD